MKKIIGIIFCTLLIVTMSFSFLGCGKDKVKSEATPEPVVTDVIDPEATPEMEDEADANPVETEVPADPVEPPTYEVEVPEN